MASRSVNRALHLGSYWPGGRSRGRVLRGQPRAILSIRSHSWKSAPNFSASRHSLKSREQGLCRYSQRLSNQTDCSRSVRGGTPILDPEQQSASALNRGVSRSMAQQKPCSIGRAGSVLLPEQPHRLLPLSSRPLPAETRSYQCPKHGILPVVPEPRPAEEAVSRGSLRAGNPHHQGHFPSACACPASSLRGRA